MYFRTRICRTKGSFELAPLATLVNFFKRIISYSPYTLYTKAYRVGLPKNNKSFGKTFNLPFYTQFNFSIEFTFYSAWASFSFLFVHKRRNPKSLLTSPRRTKRRVQGYLKHTCTLLLFPTNFTCLH